MAEIGMPDPRHVKYTRSVPAPTEGGPYRDPRHKKNQPKPTAFTPRTGVGEVPPAVFDATPEGNPGQPATEVDEDTPNADAPRRRKR